MRKTENGMPKVEFRGKRGQIAICNFTFAICNLQSAMDPGQQSFGMLCHVVERQPALAFLCAAAAQGDQPGQPAVGRPVGGPEHHRRGVVGRDLGPDDQFQPGVLGRPMRPHHAGQAVAVRHRQAA